MKKTMPAILLLLLLPPPATAGDMDGPRSLLALSSGAELGASWNTGYSGLGRDALVIDRRSQQWLRIPLSGGIGRGGLVVYNLTLRPSWFQSRAGDSGTRFDDHRADGQLSARCASCGPFRLAAAMSKATATSDRGPVRLHEFASNSFSFDVGLPNALFPLGVSYSGRTSRKSWTTRAADPSLNLDSDSRLFRASGRSSKTALSYERVRYDENRYADRVFYQTAAFDHALRWGKGSHLESKFGYQDRHRGPTSYDQFTLSEELQLRHTRRIGSAYGYRHYRSNSGSAGSRGRGLEASANHTPSTWIRWDARVARQDASYSERETSVTSVRTHASLSPQWRRGPRLSVNGGIGAERRDWNEDVARQASVLGEEHEVTDERVFLLENPAVDTKSIEIVSAREQILFVEGADYEIQTIGAFTQVRIPIGSRAKVGSTLLVSYLYEVGRGSRESTLTGDFGVTAGGRGLRASHTRSYRAPRSEPSAGRVVAARHEAATTNLRCLRQVGSARLQVDAEERRTLSDTFDFIARSVRASVGLSSSREFRQSWAMSWNRTQDRRDRLTTLAVSGSVLWQMAQYVEVVGQFDVLRATAPHRRSTDTFSAGLESVTHLALLELRVRLQQQRQFDTPEGAISRVSLDLIRRF